MLQEDRASDALFRAAFDDAPIGLIVSELAPEGKGSGRITRVNSAIEAMLGLSERELLGRTVDDITAPEDRWLVRDPAETNARRLEKRYLRADGTTLWVEVSSAYIRTPDLTPTAVIRHVEDITVRKQSEQTLLAALETQRRATEQLRGVERLREELMRTVTHELRTPLTSIYAYLELLLDEPLERRQHDMIKVAMRNAARLNTLLDELNEEATSHSADTGSETDLEIVRFDRLVSGAVEAIAPVATRNGQTLTCPETHPAVLINGDREQLHRVLLNVLANAAKYTPTGGRIEVRTGVTREGEPAVERAWVEIRDSGIGIPPEELGRLFDRDFRASTAHAFRIHGSGLGLAIAKTIVDHHGGAIAATSEPGAGSAFTITLPVATPDEDATGRSQ